MIDATCVQYSILLAKARNALFAAGLIFLFSCGTQHNLTDTHEGQGNSARSSLAEGFAITNLDSYKRYFIVRSTNNYLVSVKPLPLEDGADAKATIFAEGDKVPTEASSLQLVNPIGPADIYPTYNIQPGVIHHDKEIGVKYFTPDELARYEVIVSPDGSFYDIEGRPLPPCRGECIYVMDTKGKVYVATGEFGKIHHSSFFAAGNIAAGGSIEFDENGVLKSFDNTTGHYKVPPAANHSFLAELSRRQVAIKDLNMGTFGSSTKVVDVVPGRFIHDPEYFAKHPDFSETDKKLNDSFAKRQSIAIKMERARLEFDQTRGKIMMSRGIPMDRKKAMIEQLEKNYQRDRTDLKNRYDELLAKENQTVQQRNTYYRNKVDVYNRWVTSPTGPIQLAPNHVYKVSAPVDLDLPSSSSTNGLPKKAPSGGGGFRWKGIFRIR